MNKTFKIYAVIFFVVMIILALFEVNKTESTDWRKNFKTYQKSPFGLYVFNNEIKDLFKNKVKKIDQTPYDYYTQNKEKGSHNILVIEHEVDTESWNKILEEVSKGSNAMLIISEMPKEISDSIGYYDSMISFRDENVLKLTDTKYQNDFIKLDKFPSGRGFILSNPALKYAWWVLLGGLALFIFFNAKRKQRIVPIVEPLKNNSVDFVKSIGNLYLQEGDFHDMMSKKAQYFLNKVRMDLLIDTQKLDEEFAKKLHLKTGKPMEMIDEAIGLIKKGQDPYAHVMKEDLVRMNKILDEII